VLSFSAYFALTSTTGAGIETTAVYDYYDQSFLNDSVTYSVGLSSRRRLRITSTAGLGWISVD
jgi:hypothetical protein